MNDMSNPLQVERQRSKKMSEKDVDNRNATMNTHLTAAEKAVLSIFRKYLMTPGKMLCLGSADLAAHHQSIGKLIGKDLLVAERYRGGYSLTSAGYRAMKNGQ